MRRSRPMVRGCHSLLLVSSILLVRVSQKFYHPTFERAKLDRLRLTFTMGVLPSIVVCAAIAAASPQHNYVKYANSFCVGNFNNKSTFFQSSQNESECQAKVLNMLTLLFLISALHTFTAMCKAADSADFLYTILTSYLMNTRSSFFFKCEETNCRCFDHKPAAHQKAAECRLTNGTGIQASSENFDAYVDASSPVSLLSSSLFISLAVFPPVVCCHADPSMLSWCRC